MPVEPSDFAVRCEVTDGSTQRVDLQCRDAAPAFSDELLARYDALLRNAIRHPDRRIGELSMSRPKAAGARSHPWIAPQETTP